MKRIFICFLLVVILSVSCEDVDESPPIHNHDTKTLRNGKIIVIFSTFFITFLASIVPWIVDKYMLKDALSFLYNGIAFAAGVVLGGYAFHLLPDSEEAWKDYFEINGKGFLWRDRDMDYPFSALFSGISFLLLVLLDSVIVSHGIDGHEHNHDGGNHNHIIPNIQTNEDDNDESNMKHKHKSNEWTSLKQEDLLKYQTNSKYSNDHLAVYNSVVSPQSFDSFGQDHSEALLFTPSFSRSERKKIIDENSINSKRHLSTQYGTMESLPPTRKQIAQAYVFFVAISIHAIFDGLSIGAEQNVDGFYAMLIAVIGHKAFDGFALGVSIFYAKLTRKHVIFSLLFTALMTPFGIGIGWLTTTNYNSPSGLLSKAIVLSLSAGSFLFISIVELLPASLSGNNSPGIKLMLVAIGWAAMAVIALWV